MVLELKLALKDSSVSTVIHLFVTACFSLGPSQNPIVQLCFSNQSVYCVKKKPKHLCTEHHMHFHSLHRMFNKSASAGSFSNTFPHVHPENPNSHTCSQLVFLCCEGFAIWLCLSRTVTGSIPPSVGGLEWWWAQKWSFSSLGKLLQCEKAATGNQWGSQDVPSSNRLNLLGSHLDF